METGFTAPQVGDLERCNNEPLSKIGAVQSHSGIIFFSPADHRIQSASDNISDFLQLSHPEVVSSKIENILERDLITEIDTAVRAHPWPDVRGIYIDFSHAGKDYFGYLFESEGLFGFEIEQRRNTNGLLSSLEIERVTKEFSLQVSSTRDLASLSKLACSAIRRITGMHRVMMYRFHPQHFHGEVIAEDRVIHAHSYDGHYFPASDIPRHARDLYLQNRVRIIQDVSAKTSPIRPSLNPISQTDIDLSDSRTRAVSPLHLEYLHNMGVLSSLSISVPAEGRLWGLFACHGMEVLVVPPESRNACELIANIYAAQISLIQSLVRTEAKAALNERLQAVLIDLYQSSDPLDSLFRRHQDIGQIFSSSGLAYADEQKVDFVGLTPARAQVTQLAKWLAEKMAVENRAFLYTDCISEMDERWNSIGSVCAGVLAVLVPQSNGVLVIFRPEEVRTILWGGDPKKQLDKRDFQGRIHPRASFDSWEEVVRNRSREWADYEVEGMLFLRDFVFNLHALKAQSQR